MLPVYLLTSLPGYVLAEAEQTVHEAASAVVESLQPGPPPVVINRHLPPGVVDDNAAASTSLPPRSRPAFSSAPTDGEFFQVRLFSEPLLPTDSQAVPAENKALAEAVSALSQNQSKKTIDDQAERTTPLVGFLAAYPSSRWALSLWLNLGLSYRQTGYWTRALDAWEHAWAVGKNTRVPNARALADRAVAELAELNARLGRYERLGPLFDELDAAGRDLRGAAADKLAGARQGLWMMDHQPEISFRCGPMALDSLRVAKNPGAPLEEKLFNAHSTRQGISLDQVAALSREIHQPMQMAWRTADKQGKGADFITPAVVHWKVGHYAALVEKKDGRYRVDDPTFGDTKWVSQNALEAETDGYFLVAENLPLPAGWRTVANEEGARVWGKGTTGAKDPNATKCSDVRVKPCPQCSRGMATYNVEAMLTSLSIGDTPLSYSPPCGAPINFSVQYSQHEASQPAVFTSWNLGPKWTSQWSSYIEDNGTTHWVELTANTGNGAIFYYVQLGGVATGPQPITHLAGGGVENYQMLSQVNSFEPHDGNSVFFSFDAPDQKVSYKTIAAPVFNYTQATAQILASPRLVQTGDSAYKRYLPDGSVEVFRHSDGATTYPRRIYLSERQDPSGNTTTFSYDNTQRLLAVTDALGQVTTLSYAWSGDPLKVTRVTDPFGRSCQLSYSTDGQLASITDTVGIQSSFTYADNDFIDSLTTPYGTTTFAFADVTTDPSMGVAAWLEATDPYGDVERSEFRHSAPGVPFTEQNVPQGIPMFNDYINARNTFYWDKKAYKESRQEDGSFDYTRAKIFHFLHSDVTNVCSGILESTKEPLENRVWLAYQNQPWAGGINNGMSVQPSKVARVLDDGSTQLYQYEYNDQNRVTKSTDPLGRETTYTYDPDNGMDLKEVACTTGGTMHERLSAVDHYNTAHQPLDMYDAAGQKTTMTYNGFGQPLAVTDPTNRTTAFVYDAQGYLQEIESFDPALKSTFAYDGYGRLASTTTYPDAYTVQVGYDAVGGDPLKTLDRPQTSTFPDGSFSEVLYTNLDVEWTRDRGGNWTHLLTNKLRQVEASINPLGSVTQYGYCKCGQLVKLIDPNGNVTQWRLDAQERPAAKVYADNTEVAYTYENTTSRLRRVTDAKGQHTNYAYNLDGALQSVTYTEAEHPTPGVSYTYDPLRGRLATMQDGIGTRSYSYYPYGNGDFGPVGAGRVQSVNGPFANETVVCEYDALSRTIKRTVNGVDETYAFDNLGRLQTDTNALGAFTYSYDGATNRLSSIVYPNAQQALYTYLESNAQDRRLSQIKHLTPQGAVLDQFDYDFDGPLGRITHWSQQQPGATAGSMATNTYDLGYDATGQLTTAVLNNDAADADSGVWRYDAAGNRVSAQAGSGTLSSAVPTATNALESVQSGGVVRVAGTLSEWAKVKVNNHQANSAGGGISFEAFVPLPTGEQTVTIEAVDASGNAATKQYQLSITAGASQNFVYDLTGNTIGLTSVSGTTPQILEVDTLDRVTAVGSGTHRTEFGYDGGGKRVHITEKDSGLVTTDKLYVDGEERDAANGQVLRRFFGQGEQRINGATVSSYFYARDHLGSLREFTNSSGAVEISYGYDVWGKRIKLQGTLDTEASFTGYWHHAASDLELSPTRLYRAGLGRFLSQDPIGEAGGTNLYRYCWNDPINYRDPSGLYALALARAALGVEVAGGGPLDVVADVIAVALLAAALGEFLYEEFGTPPHAMLPSALPGYGSMPFHCPSSTAGPSAPPLPTNPPGTTSAGPLPNVLPGTDLNRADGGPIVLVAGGIGPVLQGQAGTARAIGDFQAAGGQILGEEITLIAGGVRTRLDLYIELGGQEFFVEVKNGPNAGLTPNQKIGLPAITRGGAIPVGANASAANLQPGTALPPTPIIIIKY